MAREFVDWRLLLLHGRLLGRRSSSSTAAAEPRVQARIHHSFSSLKSIPAALSPSHSLFPFLSPLLRPLLHLLVVVVVLVALLCLLWLSPLYTTTATAVSTRFIVAESSAKRPSSAQQLLLATVVVVVAVVIWEHCCRCCCCCDTGATRLSRKRRRRRQRQRPPPPENQLWRHQHFSAWVQLTHTHSHVRYGSRREAQCISGHSVQHSVCVCVCVCAGRSCQRHSSLFSSLVWFWSRQSPPTPLGFRFRVAPAGWLAGWLCCWPPTTLSLCYFFLKLSSFLTHSLLLADAAAAASSIPLLRFFVVVCLSYLFLPRLLIGPARLPACLPGPLWP